MLFNSPEFLLLFLPIVLTGFYLLKGVGSTRSVTSFLMLASLFFYGWWNPVYLLLIVASILVNFLLARVMFAGRGERYRARALLAFGVMMNLGALGFFKYANFFLNVYGALRGQAFDAFSIALPLGISFFTFQQIAFLVDVYRRQARETDLLTYSLFVTFFPQLIAGPIVHHGEIMGQFRQVATQGSELWENLAAGVTMVLFGLFKKVVLADKMAFWADQAFNIVPMGGTLTFIEAWIGVLCFTLQLYFDFSAYSDMALGLARMFGIRLPLNFDSPYKASNIVEFWHRWHMTLSRFLRDYLYFPLGGNRKGKIRRYANLMVVMALGGLWHGANWTFLFWGMLHGLYLAINHAWWAIVGRGDEHSGRARYVAQRWLGRMITFFAVVVAWVLFRAGSLANAIVIYKGLFGFNGIVLPSHYGAELGGLGGLLVKFGVTFGSIPNYGGGWQLVWVVSLLAVVWLLPNTQEFMYRYRPALNFDDTRAPCLLGIAVPAWCPSLLSGLIGGGVMLALVIKLLQGQPGEFIYFHF